MSSKERYLLKKERFTIIIIALILVSLNLSLSIEEQNSEAINAIAYKSVNISDMSQVAVSVKQGKEDKGIISKISSILMPSGETSPLNIQEVSLPLIESKKEEVIKEDLPTWRLPVERGWITSTPNYYHVAYDITSARGTQETIYPIANGIISSIYYDSAGAKIVTINHKINGVDYTSQYVHMSTYAPGIYVGKEMTTNDPIGQMGSTGKSTGNHLHIAVLDCALFNDNKCSDLNGFFRYGRVRYNQGFTGLNQVLNLPWSWSSR